MNYKELASPEIVRKTVKALTSHSIEAIVVKDRSTALETIKQLIPPGVSVMNGSSVTLEQIGYVKYLESGKHGWNDLHQAIASENNPEKRAILRRQSVLSDYYLGSVHALMENGEFIVASNTGSQLPQITFTSPNLIFVVSTKKIVPNFTQAMDRLNKHIVPLENERMQKMYGIDTSLNKLIVFKNENPQMGRKIRMILVEEDLGF